VSEKPFPEVLGFIGLGAMGLGDAAYLEAIAFGVRAGADLEAMIKAVGDESGWRGATSPIWLEG